MKLLVGICIAASLAVAGCATGTTSNPAQPQATPSSSGAAPAVVPTQEALPVLGERLADRCGMDLPGRVFAIRGPDNASQLAAATLGHGPAVAVYVHQTTAAGLCGWAPYARWAAAHGVRALLLDACGWGESTCSDAAEEDVAGWLRLAVDWARRHGARRVTLVGASMGGTLVTGAGQAAGADAIVNLSGPRSWEGVPDLVTAARSIDIPFLAAAADDDTDIDPGALRRAVAVAPARKKQYIAAPAGHGWDMVGVTVLSATTTPLDVTITALGRQVLAWIRAA